MVSQSDHAIAKRDNRNGSGEILEQATTDLGPSVPTTRNPDLRVTFNYWLCRINGGSECHQVRASYRQAADAPRLSERLSERHFSPRGFALVDPHRCFLAMAPRSYEPITMREQGDWTTFCHGERSQAGKFLPCESINRPPHPHVTECHALQDVEVLPIPNESQRDDQ